MEELIRVRRQKLEELKSQGHNPFFCNFKPTHRAEELLEKYGGLAAGQEAKGSRVAVAGRIMSLRWHGKSSFAHLMDGTAKIQVYVRCEVVGDEAYRLFKRFDIGDFLGVNGSVFKTRTGEVTVLVGGFVLLAKSLRPLPEKWHGLKDVEIRYRQRYLDLICNPQVKEVFLIRSRIISRIRKFLDDRGFLEIETPMMQTLPGGAAASPFVTHHKALGRDLYLRIAPELYLKRLVVGGLERVYEINRSFRNEGISTRHNPEFTMLELYQAYSDYEDLMEMTQELIAHLAKQVLGTLKIEYQTQPIDLSPPWERLTLAEAISKYGGLDLVKVKDLRSRAKDLGIEVANNESDFQMIDDIFKELVEPKLIQPTFITDYPIELTPLARSKPEDHRIAERFELFVGGIELANAYSELNDPVEQRERLAQQMALRWAGSEKAGKIDEDFIRALEYGMPPTGGLGIGIDRLVMVLTNSASIRNVILFPHLRPEV